MQPEMQPKNLSLALQHSHACLLAIGLCITGQATIRVLDFKSALYILAP